MDRPDIVDEVVSDIDRVARRHGMPDMTIFIPPRQLRLLHIYVQEEGPLFPSPQRREGDSSESPEVRFTGHPLLTGTDYVLKADLDDNGVELGGVDV